MPSFAGFGWVVVYPAESELIKYTWTSPINDSQSEHFGRYIMEKRKKKNL